MNNTYYQNKSNNTRSLILKIIAAAVSVLIPASMFLPLMFASKTSYSISFSASISLFDCYKESISYLFGGRRVSYDSLLSGLTQSERSAFTIFIFVTVTLILVFCIASLIFSLIKYSKTARILALVSNCIITLITLGLIAIFLIALISANKAAGSSYHITLGFGIILQALFAVGAVVVTALAIKAPAKTQNAVVPPVTPITPVTPVNPVNPIPLVNPINSYDVPAPVAPVNVQPPVETAVQPESSFDDKEAKTSLLCGTIMGIAGDYASASINIMPEEVFTIGRDSKMCNIVLSSGKVSRVHCTIKYDALNRCYVVTDMSTNGVIIDHMRPMPKQMPTNLKPGTEISIGNETNIFKLC